MKIYTILDKIEEGQIFVPAFQREYVWKRNDAKNLMASLIKDYPTGTMLTWETNDPPELKGAVDYDDRMGAVKLILDGQQRITTLFMIIRGEIPPYYTEEEIKNDTRNLYVNVETLELEYYKKTKMESNPLWINLTNIFNKKVRHKNVIKALENQGEDVSEDRDDLIEDNFAAIEQIPQRDFVEQVIPVHANIKEAIDIFYIVNASGVNLTDAELALAQISGYWPKARELFKKKLFELEEKGFVFNLDFIVYVLLGVMHNIGSDMRRLHHIDNKEKLQEAWKQLNSHTLDYVMNILRQHMYVDHTKEINSVYALVPIIVYAFNKGKTPFNQEEIRKIKKWFYYSQLRQRYVSQLTQKLDKDIGIVVKSETPFDDLLNIIQLDRSLEITPEEFVGRDIRHPLYSLMRWYFKSRNAVCFSTGVGIRQNMGAKYSLEWDHIFPYSVLKENGYSPANRLNYALMQEITNRAVLSQTANRSKSNLLAKDYLSWVEDQFPDALELQSIPMDENLWKLENFQLFLEARRKMLATQLNKFLAGITDTERTEVETPIEEIIAEGESRELEFKASMRWDLKFSKASPVIEHNIMKAVASFSNADGGTLLIGVKDSGEPVGLDYDYESLNGDKDKFELHLRNLLRKNFDTAFAANNVSVSFPIVDNIEICRIDVKRSSKPIFIIKQGKNGHKEEVFYVRSGNSSPALKPSEASEFISQRFNS
jgi:uncharacterized protein with ParB-like and HNH nuclease domain